MRTRPYALVYVTQEVPGAQRADEHLRNFQKLFGSFGDRSPTNAVLVLTPYYYKPQMTAEVLRRHFLAVAEASPVPVYLYSMTLFTGVPWPPGLAADLAATPAGTPTIVVSHVPLVSAAISVKADDLVKVDHCVYVQYIQKDVSMQ